MDMINMKCHDLRHIFNKIEGKLTAEEAEKLKEAMTFYDASIKTGNDVLDIVLCEKKVLCEQNGIQLSCVQFITAGLLSLIPAFLLEAPSFDVILATLGPIAYSGILSAGVAYTLQIIGQRGLNPTVACLLMSLESVISVLSGWIILGDALSVREITGCFLVFAGVILAQLPAPRRKKNID